MECKIAKSDCIIWKFRTPGLLEAPLTGPQTKDRLARRGPPGTIADFDDSPVGQLMLVAWGGDDALVR